MNGDTEKLNLAMVQASKAYSEWDQRNGLTDYMSLILYELLLRGNLTQKQLVDLSELPKQSINKGIHQLNEEGCLELIPSQEDKRSKVCQLTPEGEKFAKEKLKPLMDIENQIADKLGKENMHQLASLATQWSETFWEILKDRKD